MSYGKITEDGIGRKRGDDIMPGSGIAALPSTETGAVQFPVGVEAYGRAD